MAENVTPTRDGVNRRGMLQCMGWAGTGALFALQGGTAFARPLHRAASGIAAGSTVKPFSFLQISDTHVGFSKAANPDPLVTLRETIARVKALPHQPDLIVHTGDISHLAKPEQFDTAKGLLSELNLPIYFVPGEHDILDGTDPRPFLEHFGQGSQGNGWYSFDTNGVHFVALVNVVQLGDKGMGTLGAEQLTWLRRDLAHLSASTPIVVLSHFPLWALYPDWGWGTADAAEALTMLRRFGSVTALNGHIHQIQQKVEGHVRFHSARSTAYPQPAPGVGPGPGPLFVPAEQLRAHIGLTTVSVSQSPGPIAIVDTALAQGT
ncbi:MAG: metallophosphoesterase family protein [Novosphingobium sp.]